jgi:ATP-dependent DNA helicase RecG
MSDPSGAGAKLLSMTGSNQPWQGRTSRVSKRAFRRRYGTIEHERLEFKSSVNHLCECVVAMAMTAGGVILVGVGDDGSVTGCRLDQPTLDRVAAVADDVQVDLLVEAIEVGRTAVLVITVPAVAPRVVTTPDGRLLRRMGATNRPLRGDGVLRYLSRHAGAIMAT